MILAQRIKQLRKERRWTQMDLAKKIGLNEPRQISRYESEKNVPSIEVLLKIANALEVSVDYLLIEDASRYKHKASGKEDMDALLQFNELTEEDIELMENILQEIVDGA